MKSIAFLGRGGQGIVFTASILAETLFNKGFYVVQLQSYGAEVRGGSVLAYVIYGEDPVNNPFIESFNIAVLLHEAGAKRWSKLLDNTDTVIIDPDLVKNRYGRKVVEVPLSRVLTENNLHGRENISCLGVLRSLGLADYSDDDIINVLRKHRDSEHNIKAYNIGLELGRSIKRSLRL